MTHLVDISLGFSTTSSRSVALSHLSFLSGVDGQLSYQIKTENIDNEAITDDGAASAYVLNFALRVFGRADDEDRAGRANLETAKRFRAAADFLGVYRGAFNSEDDEAKEKEKYAKWKAMDITKAIREGRTPTPGPLQAEEEGTGIPDGPEVGAGEQQQVSGPSPGPEPSASPSTQPYFERPPQPSAPSLDAPTVPSLSSTLPSLTPGLQSPPAAFPGQQDFRYTQSRVAQTPSYGPNQHHTSQQPRPPPNILPDASLPPLASDYFANQAHQSPAVDAMTITNAQKHARWAISALNYEDLETARKELILALNLVGGPDPEQQR
jgi:vacuolar protein sorting-associated protein VTA1